MNEKEVSELRRRFRQDRSNITHIRGCYVNEAKEIVSEFDQSLGRTLKNSVLLFLASLPRSLGAAAILLGYLALISLFAPASYVVAVLGNVWLPLAAAFLMIYQPMEKILDLENQVHAAQEARRSGN